jgi:hypothetical protein
MYFPRNWEFGSDLSKLRNNFGGGLNPPNPPSGYALADTNIDRTASVSNYEPLLVIWNYFISYIMKMNPNNTFYPTAQKMGRLQFIRHLPYLMLMP